MKEIKSIIHAYHSIESVTTKAALATVVQIEGSSYRRTGARMLVLEDGTFIGGISGGCLEGDVLRRMQNAIVKNKSAVVRYNTMNIEEQQIGEGLGCNGIIDVLITPLQDPNQNIVNMLASVIETRKPEVLVSIIECQSDKNNIGKILLYQSDKHFIETFAEKELAEQVLRDVKNCISNQRSQTYVYGNTSVFIEIILPVTHVVIYGGNYDIYPLVRLAREMGWHITVVMNKIKATKLLFQNADRIIDSKSTEQPDIDNYTAIVLMSHDYITDKNNLINSLKTKSSYIGMLGPGKRSSRMFTELQSDGIFITGRDKERIFSPAGLDIGGSTPEEIALSIVAEIKSTFSGRQGKPLREKKGTIYEN